MTKTPIELRNLRGHSGTVTALAFSPDCRSVVSGGDDGFVRQWSLPLGHQTAAISNDGFHLVSLGYAADSISVLAAAFDGTVSVLDINRAIRIAAFPCWNDVIRSAAISADGHTVVAASMTGALAIANTSRTEWKVLRDEYDDALNVVAFAPDGRQFATGSQRGLVTGWDAYTRGVLWQLPFEFPVRALVLLYGGSGLVVAGEDSSARLVQTPSGLEIRRFAGHSDWIRCVAASADGGLLLTGSDDRTAIVWDLRTGELLQRIGPCRDEIAAIAISRDAQFVAISSEHPGDLHVRKVHQCNDLSGFGGHEAHGFSVAVSGDGTRVLTGAADYTARLWDTETGTEIQRLYAGAHTLTVAITRDGKYGASCGPENEAIVWDLATGLRVATLSGHRDSISSALFCRNGSLITGSEDGTAQLWDLRSRAALRRFDAGGSPLRAIALSEDGELALASADGVIRVVELRSGDEVFSVKCDGPVRGVVFSEDGHWFVATDNDVVSLWDWEKKIVSCVLRGHVDGVLSAAVSPSGSFVLTGAGDGIRLFESYSGQLVWFVECPQTEALSFVPNQRKFVSASRAPRAFRVWDLVAGSAE